MNDRQKILCRVDQATVDAGEVEYSTGMPLRVDQLVWRPAWELDPDDGSLGRMYLAVICSTCVAMRGGTYFVDWHTDAEVACCEKCGTEFVGMAPAAMPAREVPA